MLLRNKGRFPIVLALLLALALTGGCFGGGLSGVGRPPAPTPSPGDPVPPDPTGPEIPGDPDAPGDPDTPRDPDAPGDPPTGPPPASGGLPIGSGPRTPFQGHVTYGATGLPLPWAALQVGDVGPVVTEDGQVALAALPQGTNGYELNVIPLGQSIGHVIHDGRGPKALPFAPAPEWDPHRFVSLGVNFRAADGLAFINRWARGQQVDVVIQSTRDNRFITEAHRALAWRVVQEWQAVLGDLVQFTLQPHVPGPYHHMTISFVSDETMLQDKDGGPGVIAYCRLYFSGGSPTLGPYGQATRAEIVTRWTWADKPAVYRHEIGHCLGLNHSDDADDVMYPYIRDDVTELSAQERHVAQLMYALPLHPPIPPHWSARPMLFHEVHAPDVRYDVAGDEWIKVTRTVE